MSRLTKKLTDLYINFTGYTYSNMARLFMRLFVGVMFLQFGIRHLVHFETMRLLFPSVMGFSPEVSLIIMICIEMICSLCIMTGFLTRLAVLPAMASMAVAEYYARNNMIPDDILFGGVAIQEPAYMPIMFIGIFFYLLLAGPGKISLDYFFTFYLIQRDNRNESEALEDI